MYLLQLCRYIHLNSVKAGLVKNPEDWPYSNYLEWVSNRPGTLLDHAFVDEHFSHRISYKQFVADEQDYIESQSVLEKYIFT